MDTIIETTQMNSSTIFRLVLQDDTTDLSFYYTPIDFTTFAKKVYRDDFQINTTLRQRNSIDILSVRLHWISFLQFVILRVSLKVLIFYTSFHLCILGTLPVELALFPSSEL